MRNTIGLYLPSDARSEEAMYGITLAEMYDYDTINAMLLKAQLEEGLTKAQALARLRENNFGY